MKYIFTSLFLIFSFTACSKTVQPQGYSTAAPTWIHSGGVGAVGMCATHMDGNAVQEKIAMDRALEILAKEKESLIDTSSTSAQKEDGSVYSSAYQANTNVQASTKISAHIKATWRNPRNNNYYVLMIEN